MALNPLNLEGQDFYALKSIEVAEFHDAKDGEGEASQVHLICKMEGTDAWFVVRFKSRRPVDELIVSLITHSKAVWPTHDCWCHIPEDEQPAHDSYRDYFETHSSEHCKPPCPEAKVPSDYVHKDDL